MSMDTMNITNPTWLTTSAPTSRNQTMHSVWCSSCAHDAIQADGALIYRGESRSLARQSADFHRETVHPETITGGRV